MKLKQTIIKIFLPILCIIVLIVGCFISDQDIEAQVKNKLVNLSGFNHSDIELQILESYNVPFFNVYEEGIDLKQQIINNIDNITELRIEMDKLLKESIREYSIYPINNATIIDSIRYVMNENIRQKETELTKREKVKLEKIDLMIESSNLDSSDSIQFIMYNVFTIGDSLSPIGTCEMYSDSMTDKIYNFRYYANK